MEAIILAGGEGTRLRPLTYTTPKPLIPVGNTTLTDQVIGLLRKMGVTKIHLSIGYKADAIQNYFAHYQPAGIELDYIIEEKPMGTAGPLVILKRSGQLFTNDCIVVNGDNLFKFDFASFIKAHQSQSAIATIALKAIDDVTSRGVVALDGNRITNFVEKPTPEEAPSNLINSGYYIFSPKIFDFVDSNRDFLMLERDVFPAIVSTGGLYGFIGDGPWYDTGTPQRYDQVQREWPGIAETML